MKLVFDTNIFISAFVIPHSKAEKALLKIIEAKDRLIISKDIINEILSVLSKKFHRDREALSHIAFYLSEIAQTIETAVKLNVLKDDPDNRILECAISGNADAIVTGDKAILGLRQFKGIKMMSLKEYLEV